MKPDSEWGHTDNPARIAAARAFREAMAADGWDCVAGDGGRGPRTVEAYAHLRRDGWVAHVMADIYPPGKKWYGQASVHIWAPDRLDIKPPDIYPGFEKLQALIRHCNYCDRDDVDTERVSFAGRCCAQCLSAERDRLEYPGWTE